ncbi:retinol-binding protein pinta-like isoform X1 [Anoplolepis gracilipes]|uniref:retinol-binding protein pinta-like isoform X1 n=1 Tax=Anoplolepis gracilipes TaxID=354296 RepID=UPI003BA3724F
MMSSHSCNSVTHNLTIEQKEYAAKVLNESDENRENAVAEIKRWIQESDLRARTDDFFILQFLRVCKFNIENTKFKMRNYQVQRVKVPEWFANRDPLQPKLQQLLDLGICLPLRKLDNEGRIVILIRIVHNPNIFTFAEVFKVTFMILDVIIRDSVEASLHGVVVITDLEYMSFRHVIQLGQGIAWNAIHVLQGCYPIRTHLLNLINTPKHVNYLLTIVGYLLNTKLKQRLRIYTHEKTYDCFKNIPTNILPFEYGGTDGTIQELTEFWKKLIEENRDWFINDEIYKPVLYTIM